MSIFTKSKHLDHGAIGLYAARDLPALQTRLAEGHLARCAHCRSELHAMEELVCVLRAMNESAPQGRMAL